MPDYVYFSSDDLKELEAQFRKLVHGQGFSVLVVDKSPVVRKTIINDLKTAGFESIEEASKQTEALSQLVKCEGKIALITDLDLPGVDGIGLIKSFLQAVPDGAPLLMGDRTPKEKVALAIAAGARAFLPKPLDLAELRKKLFDLGFVPK